MSVTRVQRIILLAMHTLRHYSAVRITHQSIAPPTSCQHCSLPHSSHCQTVSGVNNAAMEKRRRLSPLDDAVVFREYRSAAVFLRIEGRRRSNPVPDVVGRGRIGGGSSHYLLSEASHVGGWGSLIGSRTWVCSV